MCGLVAMITKNRNGFSTHNLDAFATMLFVDQLRGMDSTGVFLVNNVGNVEIAKSAQNSTDFLQEPAWKNLRMDAIRNGWAMVGHNRKATRGDIVDKNAHPFWVDEKLVLVHNGSYYGDHKHLKDTEVDSEAIAHALAEGGDDVEKTLQSINAAYALIWYDVEKKTLRVIRNNQRPLFWMETGDAYYFCSEVDFLHFAAQRAGLKILGTGPHAFDVNSLDEWVLEDDRSTTLTTTDLDTAYKPAKTSESAANFSQPSREHLACAWGFGDVSVDHNEWADSISAYQQQLREESYAAAVAEANDVASEAIRKASDQGQKVKEEVTLGPDWAEKYTREEWEKARLVYATGHKVKVECKDYLSDDAGPGNIYLTGKTMDQWGLYVVFPVSKQLFSAITSPDSRFSQEKKAHFMVEVNVCGWRPKSVDDPKGKGLITLTGNHAKVLMIGNSSVQ